MTFKLRFTCEEGVQPWEDLGIEHSRPWEPVTSRSPLSIWSIWGVDGRSLRLECSGQGGQGYKVRPEFRAKSFTIL